MTVARSGRGRSAARPADRARHATRLADGRELIYFDDGPGFDRSAPDRRHVAPEPHDPEIRYDPIHDEWVIIASHRQDRTHLPPAADCPLCPTTPGHPTEIPAADYHVVAFENRFPSLVASATPRHGSSRTLIRAAGIGRCEVLCLTSDHRGSFADLDPGRLRTVGRALVDRTIDLSSMPGVEYVFCFENRGEEIGVTLHHPHGQIYAYPFVPPRIRAALGTAARHATESGRCIFCDVVEAEVAAAERVVVQTERFVAFVPAAARWPFEVHVYPRQHVPDLRSLRVAEREEMLEVQADVVARVSHLFDTPAPYIMGWMQAPVRGGRDRWHLHAEITSSRRSATKLKYLAGSESGVGVFINDIVPEQAAAALRAARGRRA